MNINQIDIFDEHQKVLYYFRESYDGHKIIHSIINDKENSFSITILNPVYEVMKVHISFCVDDNNISCFYHKIELIDGEVCMFKDFCFNKARLKAKIDSLINGKDEDF